MGAESTRRRHAAAPPRIVVYTAVAGRHHKLHIPKKPWWNVSYVAFVDNARPGQIGPWKLRPHPHILATPRRTAKFPKVMAHAVFPQATHSLWIDSQLMMVPGVTPSKLIATFLDGADITLVRHSERDCLYDEALFCMGWKLDDPDVIFRQAARYAQEGFPAHAGLAEACIVLRRHTPAIRRLNTAWWAEIERGSSRDQISFPYVTRKLGVPYNLLPGKHTKEAVFVSVHHERVRRDRERDRERALEQIQSPSTPFDAT